MSNYCSCRYCKSYDIAELYMLKDIWDNEWSIHKCRNCKACFLYPDPKEEQIMQAYDASYYGKGENKFGFSVEKFTDFFRRKRAKYISLKIPKNAKVLDIGCGNGNFLKYLSVLGDFELHGIEIEGGSAERAKKIDVVNLKIGALTSNDYRKNYFDAITLFHVFEHLPNPKETLDIIKEIIKPGGLLVISFPNIAGWQAAKFKGKWYHIDAPRHLVFFEPFTFITILDSMGFVCVKKEWFSFEQNPYGWVQSCLNVMCKKREVLYERLKGNKSYAPEYGNFNIFMQKLFFASTLPFFTVLDFIEALFKKSATVQLTFRKL